MLSVLGGFFTFLHLLGMATWIGGLIFQSLILMPALDSLSLPSDRAKLMQRISRGYAGYGHLGLLILIVTGIFMATGRIRSWGDLVSATYGIVLIIKIILVLAMITVSAGIVPGLVRRMAATADKPSEVRGDAPNPELNKIQRQVALLLRLSLALGIAILICVVTLRVV